MKTLLILFLLLSPSLSFTQKRVGYFQILTEFGSGNMGGNIPLELEKGSERIRPYVTHQFEIGAIMPSLSWLSMKFGYRGRTDFQPISSDVGWNDELELRDYKINTKAEYIFSGIIISNQGATFESVIRAGISYQRLEHQNVIGWGTIPITPYGEFAFYSEFVFDYRVNQNLTIAWRNDPEFKSLGRDPTVEELPFAYNFLAYTGWLRFRHQIYISVFGRQNLFYIRNEIEFYSRDIYYADDPMGIKMLSRFQVQLDNFTIYAVNAFNFNHLDKPEYWTPNKDADSANLFSYAFSWSLTIGLQYKFEFYKI